MSFAIIQTGGKQYKVKAGEIIKIEKIGDQKPNSIVEFKEIHDAYLLDGGTMGFKEYFDMLQAELEAMAGDD